MIRQKVMKLIVVKEFFRPVLTSLLIGLLLTGCGDNVRRSLGLVSSPPDAFMVVNRPPLELPPNYDLQPPKQGMPRPNEVPVSDQGRAALTGRTTSAQAKKSQGEVVLLKRAGAVVSDPSIRMVVNQESSLTAKEEQSLADKFAFWQKPNPSGTVVDPAKEAERLRTNAALGKPVTDGETPTIKRKERAWLEGIF